MGFQLPAEVRSESDATLGEWMGVAIKLMTGRDGPRREKNRVADLTTGENAGVVPDAFVDRIIGVIDARRPFMSTTTTINAPQAGMQLVVPKIVTRPTVGVQSSEKGDLASTDTSITTESFTVATYGGGGDISIQLLKRSDPSFLELYLRLLAEALSIELEEAAVAALIAAVADGGPEPAIALNPNALALGAAFQTSFTPSVADPTPFGCRPKRSASSSTPRRPRPTSRCTRRSPRTSTFPVASAERSKGCARSTFRHSTRRARTPSSGRARASHTPRTGRTPSRLTCPPRQAATCSSSRWRGWCRGIPRRSPSTTSRANAT